MLYSLFSVLAHASEGAESAESHGVPIVVLYQAINISILIVFLVYLTRKKVAEALAARRNAYLEKVKQSRQVLEQAEKRRSELKTKIQNLENTREQSIQQAKKDAEALKAKILKEANEAAEQIRLDGENSIQFEFERATTELRRELVEQVMNQATEDLEQKVDSKTRAVLNKKFIEKVEAQV